MKIPCVRCGKNIDSPNVYCRDCSRELEGEVGTLPAPKKRRRWPLLLMLLVVVLAGAGVWGYFTLSGETLDQKLSFLRKEVPTVDIIADKLPEELTPDALTPPSEPQTPRESARPEHPVQEEDEIVFKAEDSPPAATQEEPGSDTPEASETSLETPADSAESLSPQADEEAAQTAQAEQEQANTPEQEQADASGQESETQAEAEQPNADEETAQSMERFPDVTQDADQAASAEEESPETATAAATQDEQQEQEPKPQPVDAAVWVFWMDKEGADKTVVERLQEHGYVNSTAKGQWPGHFNDKNIFYRHEDKRGLDNLREALGSGNFYDYYYNNDRIGHNVKQIFRENDNVQFVVILQ